MIDKLEMLLALAREQHVARAAAAYGCDSANFGQRG